MARIDSTRGFFCLYICCCHFYIENFSARSEIPKYVHNLFSHGYSALTIFFALSSFLILHSFADTQHKGVSRPWLQFYTKRFFRIFPLWFVVLLIYCYVRDMWGFPLFMKNFLFLYTLQPYELNKLIVLPSWSLAVEEMFYLTFPLFVFFLSKKIFPEFLLLLWALRIVVHSTYQVPPNYVLNSPFSNISFFVYGILAYIFLPQLRKMDPKRILFVLMFLFLTAVSLSEDRKIFCVAYIFFWFLFVVSAPSVVSAFFNFFFQKLGRICFSFYLIHILIVNRSHIIYSWFFTNDALSENYKLLVQFSIALFIALLSSLILYHLVEWPSIKLGKQILHYFNNGLKLKQPTGVGIEGLASGR